MNPQCIPSAEQNFSYKQSKEQGDRADNAEHGAAKHRRLLDDAEQKEPGGEAEQRDGEIHRSAAIVASWARYAEGTDEAGAAFVVVDRLKEPLMAAAARNREDRLAFISQREVFGDLVDETRFVEAYAAAKAGIVGIRRAKRRNMERLARACGGYAINIMGDAATLKVTGRTKVYKASKGGGERHFCPKCASALYVWDKRWPEWVYPFASAIDTVRPSWKSKCT